jgi:hypothetical protein
MGGSDYQASIEAAYEDIYCSNDHLPYCSFSVRCSLSCRFRSSRLSLGLHSLVTRPSLILHFSLASPLLASYSTVSYSAIQSTSGRGPKSYFNQPCKMVDLTMPHTAIVEAGSLSEERNLSSETGLVRTFYGRSISDTTVSVQRDRYCDCRVGLVTHVVSQRRQELISVDKPIYIRLL